MVRNYSIVIKNETDNGDAQNPIAGQSAQGQDTTPKPGLGSSKDKSGGQVLGTAIVAFNSTIKPYVDQMLGFRVSTVSLRTGSQEQADRIQFAYAVGQQVYSFTSSVATGALLGSRGGPVGALVGAVMGAATSLISTAISYSNRQTEISMQRTIENVGLRYLNTRAGGTVASYNGSRGRV